MAPITFRNSRIVYYGPHPCENCSIPIVKMGNEWGGTSFTNPDGPIYPNTEWHPHVCDPFNVQKRLSIEATAHVKASWPNALAHATANGKGFVILAETPSNPKFALAISPNQTYFDTAESAWQDALRRQQENLPTWHIDLDRDKGKFISDDLLKLPEC